MTTERKKAAPKKAPAKEAPPKEEPKDTEALLEEPTGAANLPARPEDVAPGSEVGPPKEKHYDRFRNALVGRKDELAAALGAGMNVDHFIEVATTAYLEKPELQEADPISIYRALRKAAQLRLRPDNEEGYISVRKTKVKDAAGKEKWVPLATFEPMYKGLIRTLLRGGAVLRVEAQVVRSGDDFDYAFGDEPFVRHKPNRNPEARGEIIFAYAIFWLANGLKHREVMSIEEMDEIRENAKKQRPEGPAWRTNPDQMYRKMPVKRGTKFLDLDPEQAAVFRYDDAIETGIEFEPGSVAPTLETRDLNARAADAASRTVADLRAGMERMEARTIGEKKVGFGTHRDLTWAELHERLPGYITHYVLTDECPWVEEAVKDALRKWLGINGDEVPPIEAPDPEAVAELCERGYAAIARIVEAVDVEEEEAEKKRSEVGSLAHDGNYFVLSDLVDELERAASEAETAAKVDAVAEREGEPDLFSGGGR